jgi:hypothetical protein
MATLYLAQDLGRVSRWPSSSPLLDGIAQRDLGCRQCGRALECCDERSCAN